MLWRGRRFHGLQAVVELAEHLVEQVPDRGCMAVAVVAAASVVLLAGPWQNDQGGAPDPADGGQAVVLDSPVGDGDRFAGSPGDGGGPGVCLQCSGIGESGPVVADLGEHPGSGEVCKTREACDDGVVRVLAKLGGGCLFEFIGSGAGSIEHGQ